jgi:hypothetical protein
VLNDFVNRVMGHPSLDYSTVLADNKQVPSDVVIGRVAHNVFQRTIEFQVCHETFEPVPEGQEIPRLFPMKMMNHVSQLGGKVSFSRENRMQAAVNKAEGYTTVGRKDFAQMANVESDTPITVGGSPNRFSLRMVEFGELKMGDECYYACMMEEGGTPLKTLRKNNNSYLVPYETYSRPGVSGCFLSKVDIETMVFIKADNPDDPCMPFYYDNGQLKSRYDETGNNIATKFSGECGVLTREKIDHTTQCVTDRGIATFFCPSGPMADQTAMMAEDQEPAVVKEKKVQFREWQ